MHTLLLTCAGKSTRFPNYRPKWAITHPSGNLLAAEAIRGIRGYTRLVVVLREDHMESYGRERIEHEFSLAGFKAEVVSVPETGSQVETVLRALHHVSGVFTVKDCDNYFRLDLGGENSVAVVDLHTCGPMNAGNKSYAQVDGERVVHLREKEIISATFCCGAYSFSSATHFLAGALTGQPEYLSQVMNNLCAAGEVVVAKSAQGYVDWGTEEDWQAYTRRFKTLFVDIDGVLCESSHRSFAPAWGTTPAIAENVKAINAQHETGAVEVILTTSRGEFARAVTEEQLARAGLRYDRLIMGLRNCPRVLINDAESKRAEKTAFAVNLERDAPDLARLLRRDT